MSIFTRLIFGAFSLAFAMPALAFGTDTPAKVNASSPLGIMVTQASGAVLTDRDIRRINHYAAQTLDALQAFRAGTEAEAAVATLRQRVQRLVDAGQRSGLDLAQTADYFEAYLTENLRAPLPALLLDAAGRFDARSLFASTITFLENQAPQDVDIAAVDEADLVAISSVAKQFSPQAPIAPIPAQAPVVEQPVVVAKTPVIAPDAPANVRAILERVRLKGDAWVITVERGDSLGQYAGALYGDRLLFLRIFEANRGVLSRPDTISIGQELVLPKT